MNQPDRLELEAASGPFELRPDRRPRMPEPLPVRLIAVDDVTLLSPEGHETELDQFYVDLLSFERLDADTLEMQPAYRAENFILRFDVGDPPVERDTLRTQGIEILSLAETEQKLIERELEYQRMRGVIPGQESIVLRDPAGNWIELVEVRVV